MLFLKVEPSSPVPIYRQLMDQICFAIATGKVQANQKFPSTRDLGIQLKINPNTVVKAYSELVREKVLEQRRGLGTFVAERKKRIPLSRENKKELEYQMVQLFQKAFSMGISKEEIQAWVDHIWDKEENL
jgi:GntR family transcriptional regulator